MTCITHHFFSDTLSPCTWHSHLVHPNKCPPPAFWWLKNFGINLPFGKDEWDSTTKGCGTKPFGPHTCRINLSGSRKRRRIHLRTVQLGFCVFFFVGVFFCVFPSFRVFGNHWKILISIDEAIVIQMLPILIILILSLSWRDDLISTWIPGGVVVHGRKLVPRFWGFRISQSISRSRQTLESLRSANTGSSEKKRYCVLDASCSDVWGYGTQLFEEFSQCESQFCIVKSRGKSSSVYMKRSMRRLWICHCDSDPHFASCNRKRVGWCTFGRRRSQNKVKAIHHWNWNWKDISEYASLLDGRKASMQIEMSKQKVIRIFHSWEVPILPWR